MSVWPAAAALVELEAQIAAACKETTTAEGKLAAAEEARAAAEEAHAAAREKVATLRSSLFRTLRPSNMAEDLLVNSLFTEGSPSLTLVAGFLNIHDVAQTVLAVAIGRLAVSRRLGTNVLLPHMLDSVKKLRLTKSLSLSGFASLARGCKKLRDLNLAGCDKVTDACVKSLADGCKELRKLDLSHCDKVIYAGVKSVHVNKLRKVLY